MPRQARLDSPGTLHHVMIRGIEGRNIVEDGEDRGDFVRRLGELATASGTAVFAWALMSNHAHVLLASGVLGLARLMRRLLTGYAVSYNLRHRRHGHLFQNRYKSIVCDGDTYFMELVRYIHLNPLRVKLVKDMDGLESYPYCGHGVILGKVSYGWQDCQSVLAQFGGRQGQAREAYRRFVEEGVALGRRPELVGGGLVRSEGRWAEVRSRRQRHERQISDDRILGSAEFIE
jgi:putative transposase